jgi:hypothetical protein
MKRSIAIAGNMGSGKSTLVEFLSRTYGISPFYEPNEDNPYLADFYADMHRWAFHSQLYFLGNKFRLHQELDKAPGVVVLDRTIFEDAEIFATALHDMRRIDHRDWQTYWTFYQSILDAIRPPDLMIYLRCSMRTLRKLAEAIGGPPTPGVGFALGIDRIMLALGDPEIPYLDAYIVSETGPVEALEVASRLRAEGVRVDLDAEGRSVKAQFRAARRLEVPVILVWKGEGEPVDIQTEHGREERPLQEVSKWFKG